MILTRSVTSSDHTAILTHLKALITHTGIDGDIIDLLVQCGRLNREAAAMKVRTERETDLASFSKSQECQNRH